MSERGSPRASYTASFKLRVVAYAVDKGIRAAGKQFNVDESPCASLAITTRKAVKTPRNKRALRGRSAAFPELEKEVAEWINEKRKAGTGVSTNIIRLNAKLVAQRLGVSKCWCLKCLNAGATVSWFDLASPSEGEQQLLKNFLKTTKNQISALCVG